MLPVSNKVDVSTFSQTLSNRYLMNSYKLYWFAGILEEVKLGNNVISFKKLVSRMVSKSWYSLLKFKLNFGYQDRLYVLVQYVKNISGLNNHSNESDILDFIRNTNDINLKKQIEKFYRFVPYRFLSPFYYRELKNTPEKRKNSILEKLSRELPKFYIIRNETIKILNDWFEYIVHNQSIIEGWLNLRLITFLQRRNPNVPSISSKLYPPKHRKLNSASRFWSSINSIISLKSIYTGKNIEKSDFSLDHFIPWSFVMHDKLWNLVPVSKTVNSMKSDRIPNLAEYFNSFCSQQYTAFNTAIENGFSKRTLEDYLLLPMVELRKDFPKEMFIKSLYDIIKPLHQLAANQGFQEWKYK